MAPMAVKRRRRRVVREGGPLDLRVSFSLDHATVEEIDRRAGKDQRGVWIREAIDAKLAEESE